MKWLKKLFCKLFGCKCGCCEVKEVKPSETTSEAKVENTPSKKNTKKKVTKKTNKKAKK